MRIETFINENLWLIVATIMLFGTVLMAIYNGQFIMWERAGRLSKELWAKRWHRTGFFIRGAMWFVVLLVAPPAWALLGLLLAWPVYNGIINLYLKVPFFYVGKTAWIDKNIPLWMHLAAYVGLLVAVVILFLN